MNQPSEQAEFAATNMSFQEFLKQFDGVHAEWLMGNVVVCRPTYVRHQLILAFLITIIDLYLGFKPFGKLLTNFFIMYSGDDKPARAPDIMIVLKEHEQRITYHYLDGAADIAIEIVSPESELRDYKTKMREYAEAGVREYWLLDPQEKVAFINALNAKGNYERLPLNSEGKMVSGLLPGFAIDPTIFWREELPKGGELIALVQGMTD